MHWGSRPVPPLQKGVHCKTQGLLLILSREEGAPWQSFLCHLFDTSKYQHYYYTFFLTDRITLVNNKRVRACESTLLGCSALLSISAAFLDSSGMAGFHNRNFSCDLMHTLYNHALLAAGSGTSLSFYLSSAEAGSIVKATCLPSERMEVPACIMLPRSLSAKAQHVQTVTHFTVAG